MSNQSKENNISENESVKDTKSILKEFYAFFSDRLSLREDQESEYKTIETISRAIVFKGTNLWIMVFAILIASIGLNVNSTAVIIGAMLISPLMGPIMGAGLSVGINDFELFQKSIKNLAIMTFVGIIVSACYFWISPIQEAQSELLARTYPTIYDVFIALFGGFAGIVAGSRIEKGNAIPGVAIATALMPPLCTVGYGLAIMEPYYFFGALYLYFINCTFICLSTLFFVRYMKFPKKHFLDPDIEKRTKRYIWVIIVLMAGPSIYLAYNLVKETRFKTNVNRFITEVIEAKGYSVLSRDIDMRKDSSLLGLTVYGKRIDPVEFQIMKERLSDYFPEKVKFSINQGFDTTSFSAEYFNSELRTNILSDLYDKNMAVIENKDEQIRFLENQIIRAQGKSIPIINLSKEIKVNYPEVRNVSAGRIYSPTSKLNIDTLTTVMIESSKPIEPSDIKKLEAWLKIRLELERIKLIVQ